MKRPLKTNIIWAIFIGLGLVVCPWLSFAGTTPVSTPIVPAQANLSTPIETGQASSQKAEVKDVQGEVTVKGQGSDQFQNIQNGHILHAGDILRTGNGSCHLTIDGKSDLYIGPKTVLAISDLSRDEAKGTTSTQLNLESGRLKVSLEKLKKGSSFEVNTPTAVAAVRGTVFFLNTGIFKGQNTTQLYVDETHGGLLFKNTITGKSFLVGPFSTTSSFADGKMDKPQPLTKEQQQAFVKNWEDFASSLSQQFGIEEIPIPPAAVPPTNPIPDTSLLDANQGPNDAIQDKISDQNIPGANGLLPPPELFTPGVGPSLINPSPSPSPSPSSSPSPEPSPSPSDSPPPADDTAISTQEQTMIRQEISRIRGDQDFDHADANLAQISDAQTGKVFADVFGNRVRTDQYIFHEDGDPVVSFLSLTARTGDYQNGVSAVLFETEFNRGIGADIDLKTLPWNDYMNVVTQSDMAAKLGIAHGTAEYDALYQEYIIHEHNPNLVQAELPLYPVRFLAAFGNPAGNRSIEDFVLFGNLFSSPFFINIPTAEGSQDIIAQGKLLDLTLVIPANGEAVALAYSYFTGQTIAIGGGNPEAFVDNTGQNGDDGSQTAAFVSNFDRSKLLDINYYRTLAANNDGNPNNDEHPAYFSNRLNDRVDGDNVLGINHLIGAFIPINNEGRVIDQSGFKIRALRDIFHPNPLVNGGNYNLEVLLMYGYVDNQDIFHEDFRIDTIITPEIFGLEGNWTNPSALFPAALHADNDDNPPQQNT